jgi:predicted transcriptional regulator
MSQPAREPDGGSERTTVTLPTELARRLRTQARAHERSVSAIVREALEAYLGGQPAPELPSFAGVGDSGIGDLSERVDELLARAARRRARS